MVANERKLDHWTGKLKRDLHLPCGFCPFEFQSIWYKLKWKIYMWFSILDSFDYSPPVASAFWQKICLSAADTEKSARRVFRTSPNMDRVIGSWLGLLNNHHMIKNTELEFEHRTDIACDKLERILLPPYILIESRGGKWWTFCNLGAWFWSNFSANRLYERRDTWKYKFDSVMSYWKENFDPHSNFAYN